MYLVGVESRASLYGRIALGHLLTTGVMLILSVGLPLLMSELFSDHVWSDVAFLIGLGLGMLAAWYYRRYAIVWWRLWAFRHTDPADWLYLQRLAAQNFLLQYPVFSGGSQVSTRQQEALRELDGYLRRLRELRYDRQRRQLPFATGFRINRTRLLLELGLLVLAAVVVVYFILQADWWMVAFTILVMLPARKSLAYLSYLRDTDTYLLISGQGITIHDPVNRYVSWSGIRDIKLTYDRSELHIQTNERYGEQLLVASVNRVDFREQEELAELIKIYLERYAQTVYQSALCMN